MLPERRASDLGLVLQPVDAAQRDGDGHGHRLRLRGERCRHPRAVTGSDARYDAVDGGFPSLRRPAIVPLLFAAQAGCVCAAPQKIFRCGDTILAAAVFEMAKQRCCNQTPHVAEVMSCVA